MDKDELNKLLHKQLESLKEEKRHQQEFLKRLHNFHILLAAQGFGPLGPLQQFTEEWQQRVSVLDEFIGQMEKQLKKP